MRYRLGPCEFEAESRYLTFHLRESNDVLDDVLHVGQRLAEPVQHLTFNTSLFGASEKYWGEG